MCQTRNRKSYYYGTACSLPCAYNEMLLLLLPSVYSRKSSYTKVPTACLRKNLSTDCLVPAVFCREEYLRSACSVNIHNGNYLLMLPYELAEKYFRTCLHGCQSREEIHVMGLPAATSIPQKRRILMRCLLPPVFHKSDAS
jgi:hypothetical protein